ncbi:MAG TPA: tyrosine--tRNA ligase [Gemmatimonadaceae bacterium]|nr:tyrosine--tRNA ligase [Gemmatimonadaceae bacterium]
MPPQPLLDELAWRGMLHQHTDGVGELLSGPPVSAYAGFDPTAPSLHVGNLVPVMGLVHLQRFGHRPIALVGGGTGLIGDPSGRTTERRLNTVETIEANSKAIRAQLERFLDFSGPGAARMRNNADWLLPLRAIDFMRDVGKHFTINYMMAKESVKARLDSGISYTEFSYMLLQAYDFLELHRREGVLLQVGGSDQWGNITAGIELVRRVTGGEAQAITFPLFTTATGAKFGKTEAGAVWLDPSLTSPYRFYQFWINTDDRDAGKSLRYFTLLPRADIEELDRATAGRPERREAQQRLAGEMTARVHGVASARVAAEVSGVLFGGTDPSKLTFEALVALRAEIPFVEVAAPVEGSQPGVTGAGEWDVLDLLVVSKLVASKGAGRRLLEQGGVYLNGRRLTPDHRHVGTEALLPGGHLLLRRGAKDYALVQLGTS